MDTKPELAAAILERVLDAGIQAQWATGDTVYGANHQLRDRLQARGHALPTGRTKTPRRHQAQPGHAWRGKPGGCSDGGFGCPSMAHPHRWGWHHRRPPGNGSTAPLLMGNTGYWHAGH